MKTILFLLFFFTSTLLFTIQSEELTDINWPFVEGKGAPYVFQPLNATLRSQPTKGVNNFLNITGFWRGERNICCACIEFDFNDKLMHKFCDRTCTNYGYNQVSSFTWAIELPSYQSTGNYKYSFYGAPTCDQAAVIAYYVTSSFKLQ